MRACSDERLRHQNLDELLGDPVAALMMASDGVDPAEVRALLKARRPAPDGESWPRAARLRGGFSTRRGQRHS
jgi:hypothetical protein